MTKFIIRQKSRDRFTTVANATIRDPRHTWKATGLLAYLLSLPDDWRVNLEHLSKQKGNTDAGKKSGKAETRSTLRELETTGYVEKQAIRDTAGRITEHVVIVSEMSPSTPPDALRNRPQSENRTMDADPQCDSPHVENTTCGESHTTNKQLSKKDQLDTNGHTAKVVDNSAPAPYSAKPADLRSYLTTQRKAEILEANQ